MRTSIVAVHLPADVRRNDGAERDLRRDAAGSTLCNGPSGGRQTFDVVGGQRHSTRTGASP